MHGQQNVKISFNGYSKYTYGRFLLSSPKLQIAIEYIYFISTYFGYGHVQLHEHFENPNYEHFS